MLTQKSYPAAEAQYMCDSCSEAVTNPICPFCLATEIRAWLTLYPDLKHTLLPRIRAYLQRISNRITTYGTECIKCGDKRAYVCPYCFTDFVFRELQKINSNKLILQEFFEFFNFDLHHTGYTKEAEQLGVM